MMHSAVHKARHAGGKLFAAEIEGHATRHEMRLQKLQEAVQRGSRSKTRQIIDQILRSYGSKLTCVVRTVQLLDAADIEMAREAARDLDPYVDCGERILRTWELKGSGSGHRPIDHYGPLRATLQTLCLDLTRAQHGDEPIDYLRKGMGAERASDWIVSKVDDGVEHFVLADIKDYYRSVQHQAVLNLVPLPKEVTRNCILNQESAYYTLSEHAHIDTMHRLSGAVGMGLSQGSRFSPYLAAQLLGPAMRNIASADRTVIHGDDIAIAVAGQMEGKALKKAMHEILASHPAGPFRIKRCEVVSIRKGFDFLQYRHRMDCHTGEVHRRPSNLSYEKYTRKVKGIAATAPLEESHEIVAKYAQSWMPSFRRWPRNELSEVLLEQTTLDAYCRGMATRSDIPTS